jgi:hypothetical protein
MNEPSVMEFDSAKVVYLWWGALVPELQDRYTNYQTNQK